MASVEQKIAGLYVVFFNRAVDNNDLYYWEQQALSLGENIALKALSEDLFKDSGFTDRYAVLSDKAFVEAIYINTLGESGDVGGIEYWTNLLESGLSRSDMVADFVSVVLDFDEKDLQYSNLSQAEIDVAIIRGDLLTNKVTISLDFASSLPDVINVYEDINQASTSILEDVTHNISSVTTISEALDLLKNRDDMIAIINSLENINEQSVTEVISSFSSSLEKQAQERSIINNGLGVLSDFNTDGVSSLASGQYWESGLDTITYSFNGSIPSSYYQYENPSELTTGWKTLNTAQREAVRDISSELNKLLDITLVEVLDDGAIRYNVVQTDKFTAAFAFSPDSIYSVGGDIFLSNYFNTLPNEYGLDSAQRGWGTIVHELGHAMGLKHPFEDSPTLPSSQNNTNHSVMSYTFVNSIIAEFTYDAQNIYAQYRVLEPDLYSLFDVSALQAIYGVNTTTNSDNTVYSLNYSDYVIQTIWDAGGVDTIDLSGTLGDSTVDLRAGSLNSVDMYSVADITSMFQNDVNISYYDSWIAEVVQDLYDNDQLYTGLNNLAIATASVIENIITGSGNDIVTDNEVDNKIITSLGNDTIYLGNGGYDFVDGGGGIDTIYIDSDYADISIEEIAQNNFIVLANDFAVEFVDVEILYFNDVEYIL